LIREFFDIKGFSLENLQYIRRWVLFFKSSTTCVTIEKEELELKKG